MPEPVSDLMLDALSRDSGTPRAQWIAWRDEMRDRLVQQARAERIERENGLLADAYRARLREANRRAREQTELTLARLEQRIQAAEAGA